MEQVHATNRTRFNALRHAKAVLHGRSSEWRGAAQELAGEICRRFATGEEVSAYIMKLRQLLAKAREEDDNEQ
jgi:hypothetical protein